MGLQQGPRPLRPAAGQGGLPTRAELCLPLQPAVGSEKDFPMLSGKETKSHSKKGASSENTLGNGSVAGVRTYT